MGDSVVGAIQRGDASKAPAGAVINYDDADMDGEAHKDWGAFSRDTRARAAARDADTPDWARPKAPAAPEPAGDEPFDFRRESLKANARSAAESQAREDCRRSEISAENAAAKAKDLARQAAAQRASKVASSSAWPAGFDDVPQSLKALGSGASFSDRLGAPLVSSVSFAPKRETNAWFEVAKASAGIVGNAATTVMGAGVVLAGGGAAVVAPDPTTLSKPAGVGAITFGLGVMAKGVAGVSLNAANLYSALRYGSSNPDVYVPGSGAEFIATTKKIDASSNTATVVGVVDAVFDMATPYGLAKIPFSTAASTIPYAAGSVALFQPVRQTTTTVSATMAQLPGVVDKAGQYSGLVSAYGTLYDTNEREGWYGFAPPKN